MNDDTYEGWYNWETWNVMLWMNNEEPMYKAYIAFSDAVNQQVTPDGAEMFVRELMPDGTPDFDDAGEYDVVDWDEIADGMNER
jgi:hypothetical protein